MLFRSEAPARRRGDVDGRRDGPDERAAVRAVGRRGAARRRRGFNVSYAVKEIFLTLQGEGGQAGRPAVFCRFSGCNLWSGREEDRTAAVCTFCDTDFVGMDRPGGGVFPCA